MRTFLQPPLRLATDFCLGRARHGCVPVLLARRAVHERPFLELGPDVGKGEAYETARDALLQLNLMVRRGMEPDALMYTALIATMARAGLEWQAYKLFSRMIEMRVRPLPETYVALLDATGKQRTKLREQIELKIEESLGELPGQLAEDELRRRAEEDRRCVAQFEQYCKGELPSAPIVCPDDAAAATETASRGDGPVATMHIRSPAEVLATAQHAQTTDARQVARTAHAMGALQSALDTLHEEELRIYLAANRQLRHGTKAQLIERVIQTVAEDRVRDMLARRARYFGAVGDLLESDLRQLNASSCDADVPIHTVTEPDHVLTRPEREAVKPEVLHTPWGLLRKPARGPPSDPTTPNPARLERVRLSRDELALLRQRAGEDALDEVPEGLLRRYAYEHQLRWNRRRPLSLLNAVRWHVLHVGGADDAAATPALRLQAEAHGMQQTLENHEAFRVIAQRTNNLQVVDSKEINLHLKRVRRLALRQERRTEDALRREHNVLGAAELAASARSLAVTPRASPAPSHVLGVHPHTEASTQGDQDTVDELPPWELLAQREEGFNLTTGHFGDPAQGRYRELSDSQFRLLPSRTAQKTWSVDRALLPAAVQESVQEAELELAGRREAVEREYARRLRYRRYSKWDAFLRHAQAKRARAKASSSTEDATTRVVRPLRPKRYMSQLLRRGKDHGPVSAQEVARYTTGL